LPDASGVPGSSRALDSERVQVLSSLDRPLQARGAETAGIPAAALAGQAFTFERPGPGRPEEALSGVALPIEAPDMEAGSVLLVEDDTDIREALTDVLRMERWTVVPAANGKLALDRLRAGPPPDLMLLDLMMPVMDGFELLEHLRSESRPSTVVLSASRDVDRVREHPLVRATLGKPVEVGVLLGLLERLRRTEQEARDDPGRARLDGGDGAG
jgi:CheY-like chemotaxis protein